MNQADRIEMQAGDWLASQDSGQWNEHDQARLDAWLGESTAHRIAYLRLHSVWTRADRLASLRQPAQAPAERPIDTPGQDDQIEPVYPGRRWPRAANPSWWRALAATVLVAIAGAFLAQLDPHAKVDHYFTALGTRQAVTLADGSRVLLNTDTQLQAALGDRHRSVRLEHGEAFFEVAHDASRPFVIDAGTSRITVLGTRFSVRRDADKLSVLVIEGRVKVEQDNVSAGSASIVITRNDELIARKDSLLVTRRSDEQLANELSWREGQLVFDQVSLAQAAAEFNRYNRKKLVIVNPEAGKILLGGRFDTNNVASFARLLHQGFGLRVVERADEIRVYRQAVADPNHLSK